MRPLAALFLLLAFVSTAHAQAPIGVPTYYASILNWNTAAGATDIVCLEGAAGKVVKLNGLFLAGTALAPASIDLLLLRRITLTEGASNRLNPASGNPTHNPATAKLRLYTGVVSEVGDVDVNPKGFAFRRMRWDISPAFGSPLALPTVAIAAADPYTSQPEIRSATHAICLNYTSPSPPATTINFNMVWTETNE